jgi:hypothetical protein
MCIVQDDKTDWEQDAACMAEIYRNAYLTFGAASSSDSNGGCFIHTPMSPLVRRVSLGVEPANGE